MMCPNKTHEQELVFIKDPPDLFSFLTEDIIDLIIGLQERDTERAQEIEEEIKETRLVSLCPKCGFVQLMRVRPSSKVSETQVNEE